MGKKKKEKANRDSIEKVIYDQQKARGMNSEQPLRCHCVEDGVYLLYNANGGPIHSNGIVPGDYKDIVSMVKYTMDFLVAIVSDDTTVVLSQTGDTVMFLFHDDEQYAGGDRKRLRGTLKEYGFSLV